MGHQGSGIFFIWTSLLLGTQQSWNGPEEMASGLVTQCGLSVVVWPVLLNFASAVW